MNDMSQVIVPKSDQLNADDLIAGPITVTIESVEIRPGTEQPVSIFVVGEKRAWKPCKSMSRVLVAGWGPDANAYIGRSLTLYRDPTVKWGGMEIGGIRVSHLSHIERDMLLQLTATKGKRAPHIVKPLQVAPKQDAATKPDRAVVFTDRYLAAVAAADDRVALEQFAESKAAKLAELSEKRPELHLLCTDALEKRRGEFAPEGRADDQFGDQFDGDLSDD